MSLQTALQLCLLFGTASLLSIGGGNSVVPEMQRQAVYHYQWLTDAQFGDTFAIAQAAPGPSILIVSLIGYWAAGLAGALLATFAMVLPAGLLVHLFARSWQHAAHAPWRIAFEHGLGPVAVGLVLASGVVVARAADHSWAQYAVTAMATLVFCSTKLNPLIVVGIAGAIGWAGFL
ncbi:MAG TPA: chromate transporter [Stellaceae bacterium]|nr:chromate transporter [Stellaceae bacterium]